MTFPTRAEAEDWLAENGYRPGFCGQPEYWALPLGDEAATVHACEDGWAITFHDKG